MPGVTAQRLLTPAFVALSLADLLYFTAAGVLLAITPLFVVGPLSSDKAGVGLAIGAFSVTTLLLRPLVGRWSDRFGRRPLLIGGAALYAAVVLGHLVVDDLVVLVGLRLLLGAAEAFFFVAGLAALADLAPPDRVGEALSLNSLALFLGIAVGPLLGQGLLRTGGFRAGWLGAAALAGLAAVLAARVPETRVRRDLEEPTPLFHRAALGPGVVLLVGVAAMTGFLAFAVLHARQVGLDAWSLAPLVFGATVVLCRVVFRSLPDRVPTLPLAGTSLFALAAGLLVVAVVSTPAALLLGTAMAAVGVAFLTPAVFAAVFTRIDPTQRGSAAASLSIFIDLGMGVGPMALGLVAARSGTSVAFAVAAAVALLAGVGALAGSRRRT